VRVAGAADVDALVMLRTVMFEAMGTAAETLEDPRWRAAASGWFEDRLADPRVRLVVAEADGAIVSGAVGEVTALIPGPSCPNGSVGLVSNVATVPAARGRGYAGACTDALIRWFEGETDVTRIDLFATEAGSLIYRTRGFTASAFPALRRTVPR
jgi:GNAT superfamily N-acetyltransferase